MFFPVFPTRCAELSSEASTPCATDTQQAAPIKAMNADERAAGNAPANPRAARQQVRVDGRFSPSIASGKQRQFQDICELVYIVYKIVVGQPAAFLHVRSLDLEVSVAAASA